MTPEQMKSVLDQINAFDQRRVVTDATVEAWLDLFHGTDFDDVQQAVRDYYLGAVSDATLMPATLIKMASQISAQRAEQQRAAAGAYRQACGRKGCQCTHSECEAGWIETVTKDVRGMTYDQVDPCPNCRRDVETVAASATNRHHFQTMIRDKSVREQATSDHAWDD